MAEHPSSAKRLQAAFLRPCAAALGGNPACRHTRLNQPLNPSTLRGLPLCTVRNVKFPIGVASSTLLKLRVQRD